MRYPHTQPCGPVRTSRARHSLSPRKKVRTVCIGSACVRGSRRYRVRSFHPCSQLPDSSSTSSEPPFTKLSRGMAPGMRTSTALTFVSSLAWCTYADEQFKSRPDLSVPRLNITVPATSDVSDGYLFIAPYSGFTKGQGFDGPEQQAGYILRDDGDLVWSSLGYLSGWIGNMQVSLVNGRPHLSVFEGTLDSFHGHGFGHPTVLNERYERTHHLRGGNHKIISIHEFNIHESGTAMIEVYQPYQTDLTLYGGNDAQSWIVNSIFQGKPRHSRRTWEPR